MSVILFIVYCIQNQVNQKNYVGKTCVPIEKRWQAHKNNAKHGSNLAFHNAIRKYGENVFSINILAENLSDEEASEMEKQKIVELSSHVSTGKGYNMTWGGDGTGSGEQHPSKSKSACRSGETTKC